MVLSPPPSDYKEYHTDTTVKFLVSMVRWTEAVQEVRVNTSNLVRAGTWY